MNLGELQPGDIVDRKWGIELVLGVVFVHKDKSDVRITTLDLRNGRTSFDSYLRPALARCCPDVIRIR